MDSNWVNNVRCHNNKKQKQIIIIKKNIKYPYIFSTLRPVTCNPNLSVSQTPLLQTVYSEYEVL